MYFNKKVNPKGNKLQTEFNCSTGELEENYTGLEIISSEKVAGLPTNSSLLNPAIVYMLIVEKKIKDYSLEENTNETIPDFTILEINTTNSSKTGKFYIKGYPSEKIKNNNRRRN